MSAHPTGWTRMMVSYGIRRKRYSVLLQNERGEAAVGYLEKAQDALDLAEQHGIDTIKWLVTRTLDHKREVMHNEEIHA